MHELSVCQGLLRQLAPLAAEHSGAVQQVVLRIGPLSGVEPSLLQAAFPIARKGTVAEQAELVIESTPLRVRCKQCHSESEVSSNNLSCRQCGHQQTQLISGDELLLVSVQFQDLSSNAKAQS